MEKMTKRDYFNILRDRVADDAELVAFIDHELVLLEKKNTSRSNKPTARQSENAELAITVNNAMESGHAYTVSELAKSVPALSGMTPQRVTAIIRILLKAEEVTRSEVKGKVYFTKN